MPDEPDELNETEYVAKQLMPAPTALLADELDITPSYVRDLMSQLRDKGYTVAQDAEGRYYIPEEHDPPDGPSYITDTRSTSEGKAAITRKVKKVLAEMEHELKASLAESEPAVADGGLAYEAGNEDLIIHRTDDHFGEVVTNQHGDETFNSEIAEYRVRDIFDAAMAEVERRRDMGVTFDTANLLLGGDIVTNEAIYDGQPHDIDETLGEQINRAADVYIDNIKRLADTFPTVQVACQPGNHGRIGGRGNPSNADSILYSMIDKVVRESEYDNVTVLQSSRSYYVDFTIRDWNAHLRHGHDASLEHIGTSSGKQRWLSWLVDHGFDVAFRGHYHALKEEPVNGVPVVMGGAICPQTEFEESRALSGRAIGAVHGASDDYPLEWTQRITFE